MAPLLKRRNMCYLAAMLHLHALKESVSTHMILVWSDVGTPISATWQLPASYNIGYLLIGYEPSCSLCAIHAPYLFN